MHAKSHLEVHRNVLGEAMLVYIHWQGKVVVIQVYVVPHSYHILICVLGGPAWTKKITYMNMNMQKNVYKCKVVMSYTAAGLTVIKSSTKLHVRCIMKCVRDGYMYI